MEREKITVLDIKRMKEERKKIVMLTAYDTPTAQILDEVGVDIILVGDSLGNNVLGYKDTLSVTMEDMVRHTAAVRRGTQYALLVGDMPFGSCITPEIAAKNAMRLVQEGGAEAVKPEGGKRIIEVVKAILNLGVPVMGHIGLTPQSIHIFGGHKVQARTEKAIKSLIEDAKALDEAGVFSIVLEGIPWQVAKLITESVEAATIGIGAGIHCDGQVLVLHDAIGINQGFKPKFVKRFGNVREAIKSAVTKYKEEVEKELFPTEEYSYSLKEEVAQKLEQIKKEIK
ncbi:MAG: 3-methyl-2-oxobutanoate hydroxymethyltransferase [Candidatus Freyarchaeota archaeon]|nr:3-methyl-2-oxobutanoate hydroxymethyltransferase [Candidatus Jordarchaeia archaeon]MBS7268152.1 3-methyl-2-oxobutanoate hydroxymethyltransferase [Candidatus Jordarchaeia archaeon]